MKKFISFFILFLILLPGVSADEFPKNYFVSPVEFPLNLSANFGELRTNAFHAGIDIRTGGVTGKRILASADGFVYRIRVSPTGYGRALYVEHPNGLATVYAHLDGFNEELENYVRQEQYKKQSFDIDLAPPKGRFKVRQGELIGYSGNTGSSSGPHLHFEIREAGSQMPVNPLLFDFKIRDNLPPVLYTLAVYPLSHNSYVNGKNQAVFLPLSGGGGSFRIRDNVPLEVYGEIGFGIQVTDFLNDSPNRCGAWSVELMLDENSVYRHELTRFSFDELRHINSHIDYAERMRNRRDIQRTFLQPNNRMRIYDHVNRGIGLFYNEAETPVRLIVKDAHKNRSELSFTAITRLPAVKDLPPPPPPPDFAMLMSYDTPNNYSAGDVMISLPVNSLYEDLLFEFKTSPPLNRSLSPVYHIHNRLTPVHRNYNLSINAAGIPDRLRNKALIVYLDNNNGNPSPLNSRWQDGFMHASPNVFGRFSVMIDTIPPLIEPLNISAGRDMSNQRMIRFRVTDDLSGIRSYEGYIDNEWVLFEFDPKNDHLFYLFDESRIGKGRKRELRLNVTDHKNNVAGHRVSFYY
jgi:hypothetical protein